MRRNVLAAVSSAALVAGALPASADSRCGSSYQIEPGDTLFRVSQLCRVGLSRIYDLNPGLNPRDLSVGAEVRLTADAGAGGRGETEGGAPTDGSYRVEPGDTAYSIAQTLGISLIELLNENEDLDPLALAVGDVLDIPTDDRSAAVSIRPRSGPAGSEVALSARNLRPNDVVTIGVGKMASEWRAVDEVRVADDGEMTTRVRVPRWAGPEDVLVFVIDTDRGYTFKSDDFDVEARDDEERVVGLEGWVRDGVECATLRTPDGDLYSLVSAEVEFTPGEYVVIDGARADMSFCQQGRATIEVSAIDEVAPPVRGDDGPATDPVDLTRTEIRGPWTAKGSSCTYPDFDVTRYAGGGLAVETSLGGAARTGDVTLEEDPSFIFDQPQIVLDIESRGEGELAVRTPDGDPLMFGGHDIGGDGVVFVRC